MLEKQIQRQILDYINAIGAYGGKTKTMGVRRGKRWCFDKYLFRGFPDITFFHNQRLYFVEVKRKGNGLSDEQIMFSEYASESNQTYIVAYCVEDVKRIVDRDNMLMG